MERGTAWQAQQSTGQHGTAQHSIMQHSTNTYTHTHTHAPGRTAAPASRRGRTPAAWAHTRHSLRPPAPLRCRGSVLRAGRSSGARAGAGVGPGWSETIVGRLDCTLQGAASVIKGGAWWIQAHVSGCQAGRQAGSRGLPRNAACPPGAAGAAPEKAPKPWHSRMAGRSAAPTAGAAAAAAAGAAR